MPKRIIGHLRRSLDPESDIFLSSTNWFLMAFISGAVNAGGYLACHRFVTHVTGFSTQFGVGVIDSNFNEAIEMITVPLFFLLGAAISAYFIDYPFLVKKKPRYYISSGMISVLLLVCAIGGHFGGWFGVFGEPLLLNRDYALLCLLVLAAGMQNSAATSASSGTVRTTHLTGLTTDVGIGIMRTAAMRQHGSENYKREKILLLARTGIIIAFVMGSLIGVLTFKMYGYLGFLLPGALSLMETMILLKYRKTFEQRHSWLRLEPFERPH